MKLLLDTQVFLWLMNADVRLPVTWREQILDLDVEVYLSVATVWECVIEHRLGKLSFPEAAASYLPAQRERHDIQSLTVDEACLTSLEKLPLHHRDPFDRIIISQALYHGLTLVSTDTMFQRYNVPLLR